MNGERIDERELDRLWNDLAGDKPPGAAYRLPREAADTVRLFQSLASTPPSEAARERVGREVMAAIDHMEQEHAMSTTMTWAGAPPTAIGRVRTRGNPWTRARPEAGRRWTLASLAMAALVLIAVAGSWRLGWDDRWLGNESNHAVLTAPAKSCGSNATATPAGTPVPVAVATASPAAAIKPNVSFAWAASGVPVGVSGVGNLAIDPQCRLWAVDADKSRFLIFNLDGKLLETWGSAGKGPGQFNFNTYPSGNGYFGAIAFAPDGGFYVADDGNLRVQQFDGDRKFVRQWTISDSATKQTGNPLWITVGPDGNVAVSTQVNAGIVQLFSPDGVLIRTFGAIGAGSDRLTGNGPIAFDPAGNIWLLDAGVPGLVEFSPAGTPMARIALPSSMSTSVYGFAIDAAGRFLIPDSTKNQIDVLDSSGTLLYAWGAFGVDPGKFATPHAVFLDGDGSVYVSEIGQPRIQKFDVRS